MREEINEFSDDEIMDIELAEALERENATIIELELEKELRVLQRKETDSNVKPQ